MKTLVERIDSLPFPEQYSGNDQFTLGVEACSKLAAEHDAVMAQMAEALKFAEPFAQAEWFKCIGNAPTSDAGYDKWSACPAVIRMKGGMDSIKAALSAYQSLGEQS